MRGRVVALISLSAALFGCGKLTLDADTRASYEVTIRVSSDPGKPVPGAQLLTNGNKVGVTEKDGSATLKFVGNEGESYDIQVECPAGLQSPSKPIAITLRKLASPSRRPEFLASCPPATQVVVVAVRADNGPNLPVLFLGKEVARTDSAGAAHVALRMSPNDTFELKLGTDDKGNERLHPQNPTASFTVKDHDDIVPFDQRFTVDPVKRFRGKGKSSGPTRLLVCAVWGRSLGMNSVTHSVDRWPTRIGSPLAHVGGSSPTEIGGASAFRCRKVRRSLTGLIIALLLPATMLTSTLTNLMTFWSGARLAPSLRKLIDDRRGAMTSEYVILVGTVGLLIVGAMVSVGPMLLGSYYRSRAILIGPYP